MSGMELCGGLSGIVLAGGLSRRMGQNKAELCLNGKTFLEIQVEKFHALGIADIMLSGAGCPVLPGTRVIPDEYTGRGPFGGLHACLQAARNPFCLVVSVDVPLIPVSTLAQLCRAHKGGITILRHHKREEPLIGVYDRCVSDSISELIRSGRYAVRALKDSIPWNCFDYSGPRELLINCNTLEDFAVAKNLWANILIRNPSSLCGEKS